MRKFTLALSAAALALAGGTAALADDHGGKRGPMAADTNGDGQVTLAEAKAQGAARFAKMDVNGDGAIDRADREARAAERFAKVDADGNGELSPAEMKAAHEARAAKRAEHRAERMAKRFEKMDADGSGGLSEAELKAAHAARKGQRGEGRKGQRGEMRQKMAQRMGERRGGQNRAMMMLRQADANKDRSVSRAEFDAAIEARFARVDTDNSGSISAAEQKAAQQAMRAQHKERMERRRPMREQRKGN